MFVAVLAMATFAQPAAAQNLRKYAGIVVDAKTGKVLYESDADATRYPASVTKVMTLYVLFQELQAGNVKLSDKMTVSKHAASAVPTKLGLKAGATISVEDAIKSLVTLSANDMARVIAEHISGSESAFARRMTETAKGLGMSKTTYRNASGLPDSGQKTTARDQVILGIAVYQHFPKYYEYFQTRSFSFGKRTYGNHNRLLGSNGVDGIKTGYINASGFNLLTAARSSNRHIVVVGFGFNTSSARDSKVRELVRSYLPKARQGDYLQTAMIPKPGRGAGTTRVAVAQPTMVVPAPRPSFRLASAVVAASAPAPTAAPQPVTITTDNIAVASIGGPVPAARPAAPADIGVPNAVAAASALGGVQEDRPLDVIGAWLSETFSLGAPPAALGQTRPSAPLLPPVGVGADGQPVDLMTSGSSSVAARQPDQPVIQQVAAHSAAAAPQSGGWIVQIGAAPSESGANSLISDAASKVGGLGSRQSYIERFEKNGQVFYRARFGGFDGRDAANTMCNELKKAKMSCLAMQS
ncbi:D-alanyl-D-alanine carboxypeptidase [Devosia enhydra]|nr:D-alanyl-D-alanine carboxypeptidase [Devosia enhydra]